MISTTNMAAMVCVAVLTTLGPLALLILWGVKKKVNLIPAMAGVIVFMVFARTLEMIPHMFFLLSDNPISRAILSTPLLYAIYGGLAAGIFEETGRFTAFHFLRKKYPEKETAITYGIGHGGFEIISIVGIGFIQYVSIAFMINSGSMDSMMASATGEMLASMKSAVDTVSAVTVTTCILAVLERIYALIFHIALSVLVHHAVTVPGKRWLFPAAILLHAGLDFFAGLYQTQVLPLVAVEIISIFFTSVVALWAYQIYTGKKIKLKA